MSTPREQWPDAYELLPDLRARREGSLLRPIGWTDRIPIRIWRNEQISVLRQTGPLTQAEQDRYFAEVIRPQMAMRRPPQVLFAYLEGEELVGYGGLVHIAWTDRRAEVSFLTKTSRTSETELRNDWFNFLGMLVPLAHEALDMHKLTTETFASRAYLPAILEEFGFLREGRLREHHRDEDSWIDSIVHGLILPLGVSRGND